MQEFDQFPQPMDEQYPVEEGLQPMEDSAFQEEMPQQMEPPLDAPQEEEVEEEPQPEPLPPITQYNQSEDFYKNLAIDIEREYGESALYSLASQIEQNIEADEKKMEDWTDPVKAAFNLLGIKNKDLDFNNLKNNNEIWEFSSKANSTGLLQAWLQAVSTATSELLPPKRLLKTESFGELNEEQLIKADNIEDYGNYFLNTHAPEFRSEITKAISWAVLTGSGFIKTYFSPILNRPVYENIKTYDLIVPDSTKSLRTASRISQRFYLSDKEMKERIAAGLYRDIELSVNYELDDEDEETWDGATSPMENNDLGHNNLSPTYQLYEVHLDLNLIGHESEDNIPLPYIVTLDKSSKKILRIVRNWRHDDPTFKKFEYFTQFSYVQGFNFYNLGIAHLCGATTIASTALLRQLIDANTLSNYPTGFKSQGMRSQGNVFEMKPFEFHSIDTNNQPIEQALMQLRFPGPNQTSIALRDQLEASIKEISFTTSFTPENVPSGMAAASVLALIEKGNEGQNAVLGRFHRALTHIYELTFRIFKNNLPQEPFPYDDLGTKIISAHDFVDGIYFVPTSDSNLTSKMQRIMRAESILNFALQNPELHNLYKVYRDLYTSLGVENVDEILINPDEQKDEPVPADPLTENINIMNGVPVVAGWGQNHEAHQEVVSLLINDPQVSPEAKAAAQAHYQDHESKKLAEQILAQTGLPLPQPGEQLPPEVEQQVAVQMAQAAAQMNQQLLEQQGPPSQDPTVMAMMEDIRVREEQNKMKHELEVIKLKQSADKEMLQMRAKLEEMRIKNIESLRKQQEELIKQKRELYKVKLEFYKNTGQTPPDLDAITQDIDVPGDETLMAEDAHINELDAETIPSQNDINLIAPQEDGFEQTTDDSSFDQPADVNPSGEEQIPPQGGAEYYESN